MKNFKNTPAFIRYFKARFKPFTKPLFLGSFGGLLIAGLAIYQYWQHPEWLQTNTDSTLQQAVNGSDNIVSPSPEELSVAADIDNSDLLLKELEQNQSLNQLSPQGKNNQTKPEKRDSEYSRFQKSQRDKIENPRSSSEASSNSPYSNTGENKKITELLQPPSLNSFQSRSSSQNAPLQKFQASKVKVIPNPIGNVYLSNRKNKLKLNTTEAPKIRKTDNAGSVAPVIEEENNTQEPTNNIINTFVPASSLIQSQQTLPYSAIRSSVPSSTASFNVTNPYLGTGFNSVNSSNSTSQNNLNSNRINPVNGNTTNNFSNNSYSNNINPTTGNNYPSSITNTNNSPNFLQNNYNSSQPTTPNYSRSVPNGYQLQPQNYTQNSLGQTNGFGSTPTVSNVEVNSNSNNLNQQTNNASGVNNYTTPSLQPSGVLTTGEIRR